MADTKQITVLVIITLLVGIVGLVLVDRLPSLTEEDVVVDDYVATLYANGTLVEDYTYLLKVSNKYRMLYRVWDAPLSTNALDRPYIQFLRASSPQRIMFYVKDYQGSVLLEDQYRNNSSILNLVRSLATQSEVGIFNPSRFSAGRYSIRYVFQVHPPLESDSEICHLNLQLAKEHLRYRSVKLILKDTDYVLSTYTRPASLTQTKGSEGITYQGSIEKNELLELEILFKIDVLQVLRGFPRRVNDVTVLTVKANNAYLSQYYIALGLLGIARIMVLIYPFVLLLVYVAWGRERNFVVPKYLSIVPNKQRKPWLVNLVFKGDAFDFDDNGFYATLLDLHMRKKIRIDTSGKDASIRVLDRDSNDVYESRLLRFLSGLSRNEAVSTDSIKSLVESITESGSRMRLFQLQSELTYLMRTAEPNIASQFVVSGRKYLLPSTIVSGAILALSFLATIILPHSDAILTMATATGVIPLIQSVIALVFPSTLFGRWIGETYREKLEWNSFRNFLSDLALMSKYSPQDVSIWGEWLIYGTALGVGDKVVEAMKELKIELPEATFVPIMPLLFHPMMVASMPVKGGGVGGGMGGGGGGFGAGGGFGGGGAGAR